MRKFDKAATGTFIVIVYFAVIWGCGTILPIGQTFKLENIGFSMPIPKGWQQVATSNVLVDKDDETNRIEVKESALDQPTLVEYVKEIAQYQKVISQKARIISRHDAIEVFHDDVWMALDMYIKKGENIVIVNTRVRKEVWEEQESALRKAIDGITIK